MTSYLTIDIPSKLVLHDHIMDLLNLIELLNKMAAVYSFGKTEGAQ